MTQDVTLVKGAARVASVLGRGSLVARRVHSRKFFRAWKRGQTEFPKFLEVDILGNVGGDWSEVGGAGIVMVGGGHADGGWCYDFPSITLMIWCMTHTGLSDC